MRTEKEFDGSVGNEELILVLRPNVSDGAKRDLASLAAKKLGASIQPLFLNTPEERDSADDTSKSGVAMSRFLAVDAPDDDFERLATKLRSHEYVEAAYVKPAMSLPRISRGKKKCPPAGTGPVIYPQEYRGEAPVGVDADYAASMKAQGQDVTVVDLEWNWDLTHEELRRRDVKVLYGERRQDKYDDHGTAVLGILGADDEDGSGISGICPRATIAVGVFGEHTATTIDEVCRELDEGSIIVIPFDRSGPDGFKIPIEWWPDDFAAIARAVQRGIIVVSAAGNGGISLDDARYSRHNRSFPASWNPFSRNPDSGAVLVGAGAPPPLSSGGEPDRSRVSTSNYGSIVDAQGWGRGVATLGFGHCLSGTSRKERFTLNFGSTSAASTMVAGVLACVQGARKAAGKRPLTSVQARELLLELDNGSPQQWPGQPGRDRIGNRPNLRALLQPFLT